MTNLDTLASASCCASTANASYEQPRQYETLVYRPEAVIAHHLAYMPRDQFAEVLRMTEELQKKKTSKKK